MLQIVLQRHTCVVLPNFLLGDGYKKSWLQLKNDKLDDFTQGLTPQFKSNEINATLLKN